jgi:class I fructose-bisphosphate aldolase/fructose-bisphosphate aldolase/2-amino-3,7-dideoxy-D-threo-hept-6-ulosonate synthase
MGGPGWTVRMARVFGPRQRTVLVALDHLAVLPEPEPALRDPAALVSAVRAAGADGVIITRGALTQSGAELAGLAVVLSVPLDPTIPAHVPELALRLGADLVKVIFTPFTDGADDQAATLGALCTACHRWDLPVLVETVPGGFRAGGRHRHAAGLTAAARMATELGAAAIKTFMPQQPDTVDGGAADPDGLRDLCRYAGVPVLLLGGRRIELSELVELTTVAIEAGAAGVAIGRNVWGADSPGQVVGALVRAVRTESTRVGA